MCEQESKTESDFLEYRAPLQAKKKERESERLNDDNNNGQLRIAIATSGGACKAAWAKKRKLVITMASYALQTAPRVAHASRLGQNQPSGYPQSESKVMSGKKERKILRRTNAGRKKPPQAPKIIFWKNQILSLKK